MNTGCDQKANAGGRLFDATAQGEENVSEVNMTSRVRWDSQNTATAPHHLLSVHGRFHPHVSLLFFMVVTNRADPELRVQASTEEKQARAEMHVIKENLYFFPHKFKYIYQNTNL